MIPESDTKQMPYQGRSMFTVIHMKGTPYERGLTYGKEAKEKIYRKIEEYKVLFDKESHISWEKAKEVAQTFLEPIQKIRPDLIEEMRGIAEGAGVDFETILTLNCRTEIMFTIEENECTAIGVPPEASSDSKTYLAQNWDWWSIGEENSVVIEVEQAPYAKALIVTEAGVVGGKGLNECGVALSLNALSCNRSKKGLPVQILLRHALSQKTLPKAINTIASSPRAGAASVGLASADGNVVFIEYTSENLDVLTGKGQAICHTNHWLSLFMKTRPETSQYSYSSTFTRLDRAIRLVKLAGKLNPEKIHEILSDHAGFPEGICRHADPEVPVYHRHSSSWSMVIDPKDKVLWLTDSQPCKSDLIAYRISD